MDLVEAVEELRLEVAKLKAEAEARRVLGRYMFLCDVPNPEFGMSDAERCEAIGALFTEDAIWEGVGGTHGAQFGQHRGPAEIAAHMTRFYSAEPKQMFNTHYVTTGQVVATDDGKGAEGRWVQMQPWINEKGESIIRSSRLQVRFRETEQGWKMCRYRTESLFIGDLPTNWTRSQIKDSFLFAPID